MPNGASETSAPPPLSDRERAQIRWGLVALGFAIYMIVPYQIGDQYPLCRFAMFSHAPHSDGRLLAEFPDGTRQPVLDIPYWQCPESFSVNGVASDPCPDPPTNDERLGAHHILSRPSPSSPGISVRVFRQHIAFPDPDGPSVLRECAIATCTVASGDRDGL